MLTVCSLQSGSTGNCTYVATESTRLLIDAGMSGVEIQKRLAGIGVDIYDINALLITHDHSDHVGSASVLGSRYSLPVFITKRCFAARNKQLRKIRNLEHFQVGENFAIGDIDIDAVPVPHDATETCGFTFESDAGARFGIFTDLGSVTEEVAAGVRDLDSVLFETNHDTDMLLNGKYPQHLKDRVHGPHGHLSNAMAAEFLRDNLSSRTRSIFLAHLSHENNTQEIALRTLRDTLAGRADLATLETIMTFRYKPTAVHTVVAE